MTTYSLTIALAATNDGHMFFGADEAGLTVTLGGDFEQRIVAAFAWHEALVVDAGSIPEALNVAMREANIGEDGWAARYREEGRQRSLSVGDLVIVESDGQHAGVFQVLPFGFGEIDLLPAARVVVEGPWSHDAARAVVTA